MNAPSSIAAGRLASDYFMNEAKRLCLEGDMDEAKRTAEAGQRAYMRAYMSWHHEQDEIRRNERWTIRLRRVLSAWIAP